MVTWLDPATMTMTATDVVRFPAASRATAVSAWLPAFADAVFQAVEYGAPSASAPSGPPSSWNCTPTTPTLSFAFAATVIVPETVAFGDGEVIATDGGVASPASVANVK